MGTHIMPRSMMFPIPFGRNRSIIANGDDGGIGADFYATSAYVPREIVDAGQCYLLTIESVRILVCHPSQIDMVIRNFPELQSWEQYAAARGKNST